jgi:hypothetical protein
MTTKRYVQDGRPTTCAHCGGPLSPRQRYNHNQACSMQCREALKAQQYPPRATACEYCGKVLSPSAQRERRRYCSRECGQRSRTHRPAPVSETPPAPIVAPEPAQRATGPLWAEPGRVYVVGNLNGRAVVWEEPSQGRRRVYCGLADWPRSAAGRRQSAPKPDEVVYAEVKVGPRVWRNYPLEVEV